MEHLIKAQCLVGSAEQTQHMKCLVEFLQSEAAVLWNQFSGIIEICLDLTWLCVMHYDVKYMYLQYAP